MARYCCPDCGHQLSENDVYVNLAHLLFSGGDDKLLEGSRKLLVSRENLSSFFQKDITLEELLLALYPDDYISFRDRILEIEKQLVSEIESTERTIVETDLRETDQEDFNFDEEDDKGQLEKHLDELNKRKEEVTKEVNFLDLTKEQKAQLWRNRLERVVLNPEGYGFHFSYVNNQGEKSGGSKACCRYCASEIINNAFRKKQYVVGIVGTSNVGKSCLIAAMCNCLSGHRNGRDDYPIFVQNMPIVTSSDDTIDLLRAQTFKEALKTYRKGQPIRNTDKNGLNCVNPTVDCNDVIWTFVDVAGEAIRDPNNQMLDGNVLRRNFDSILQCDAYIFCVGIDNPRDAAANNAIGDFIDLLDDERSAIPFLLVMTKADSVSEKELNDSMAAVINRGETSWIGQEYHYARETAYVIQNMWAAYETVSKYNYCTAISASAYGFVPEKNTEKEPEPRNVGLIIDWIKQLFGDKAVVNNGRQAISMNGIGLKRSEMHLSDDKVYYISRMFSNPRKGEKEYYRTINKGLYGGLKQLYLRFKYKKEIG